MCPLLYPSLNAAFLSVAPTPVDESTNPSLPALLPCPMNQGDPGFTCVRAAAPHVPGAAPYPWSFLSLSVWGHCERCHNKGFFRAILHTFLEVVPQPQGCAAKGTGVCKTLTFIFSL